MYRALRKLHCGQFSAQDAWKNQTWYIFGWQVGKFGVKFFFFFSFLLHFFTFYLSLWSKPTLNLFAWKNQTWWIFGWQVNFVVTYFFYLFFSRFLNFLPVTLKLSYFALLNDAGRIFPEKNFNYPRCLDNSNMIKFWLTSWVIWW